MNLKMHKLLLFFNAIIIIISLPSEAFNFNKLVRLSTGFILTLGIEADICPSSMCPSKANFYVEKANPSKIRSLKVDKWNTWSSSDSPSYAVHNLKNKVYTTNELCYIDRGKFKITPKAGESVEVKAGDFILFPKDFACTWDVEEPVFKHWYEYE